MISVLKLSVFSRALSQQIQGNFYQMLPIYQSYPIVKSSNYIENSSTDAATHSQRSKMSSRKGSTDIDSRTKFKTEVCKYWANDIECPYGDNCNFAHGKDEKRMRQKIPSKYKTRGCNRFLEDGYCPYGNRCQFIHCSHTCRRVEHRQALDQLRKDNQVFYAFLEVRENLGAKFLRLPIFQSIGATLSGDNSTLIVNNQVDVRPRHSSF